MERYVTFSFSIDTNYLTHLKARSFYNHNYFEIDLTHQGDYVIPEKCNILFEQCSDDDSGVYYSLGYFEGEKFKSMFTWYENDSRLH